MPPICSVFIPGFGIVADIELWDGILYGRWFWAVLDWLGAHLGIRMKSLSRILFLIAFLVAGDKLTSGELDPENYARLYHAVQEFSKSVNPGMSPKELQNQLAELTRRHLYQEKVTYVNVGGSVMTSRAAREEFTRLSILKLRSREQRKLLDQFQVSLVPPGGESNPLRSVSETDVALVVENQSTESISEIRVEVGWKTNERGTVWFDESELLRIVSLVESKDRKEVMSDTFWKNVFANQRDLERDLTFRVVEVFDSEGVSIARDPFLSSDRNRWQVFSQLPENVSGSVVSRDK